jgi:H2-forming N5,N10-methylenetetrahydromethanopterin dehydrogenase-like enzyme
MNAEEAIITNLNVDSNIPLSELTTEEQIQHEFEKIHHLIDQYDINAIQSRFEYQEILITELREHVLLKIQEQEVSNKHIHDLTMSLNQYDMRQYELITALQNLQSITQEQCIEMKQLKSENTKLQDQIQLLCSMLNLQEKDHSILVPQEQQNDHIV